MQKTCSLLLLAATLLFVVPAAVHAQADPTFVPDLGTPASLTIFGQVIHQTLTSPYSDCTMIITAQSTDPKIADVSPKGPIITNSPITFDITAGTSRGGTAIIIYLIKGSPDGCVKGYQYNYTVKLTDSNKPTIKPSGVTPLYSPKTSIQAGSWFSVYGSDLTSGSDQLWKGQFEQSLGGTSLTVNSKPASLWFVGANQINAQAPDDTATGTVPVVVTTPNGSFSTTVTLAPQAPAFSLLSDGQHIAGIIYTPNGGGSQGGGTYDFLGPASIGAGFRPAKKGEKVAIFGIGFGATNPFVPAGQIYTCPSTGCAQLVTPPVFTVGPGPVALDFAGMVQAGLYQFNFTVPTNVNSGDLTVFANAGGVLAPNFLIPVQ